MYRITRRQLYKACINNDYIILRRYNNSVTVLNCKIAFLSRFQDVPKDKTRTKYFGWRKCSFQEYISYKTPFIICI